MILYFLSEYSIKQEYPKDMLPTSVVSDFEKIIDVFKMANEEALLEELMDTGHIDFTLTRSFNFTEEDFLSSLFYNGMLTSKKALSSNWRFTIPNNAIRGLFYEHLPFHA
jgi:hypothetical protein